IYPGRGKTFVRGDSRTFRFVGSKSESLFMQRKNPRKISWTVLYRRMHRKGITEEVTKKRTRRTVKYQRGVVGASWDTIKAKREQKPEVRAAVRKEAIEKAKAEKKSRQEKKAGKPKQAA
ncbi:60S ribosomal protein L24, partial [Dispira simplex]